MGAPAYHRPTLVALILYAFFNDRFSAEEIHEFALDNLGAIWILQTMNLPSEKTIERVLFDMLIYADVIFEKVFQLCDALQLVGRKRLFIDGRKSKANASKHKAMSYKPLCDKIETTEEKISEIKGDLVSTITDLEEYTDEELEELICEQAKILYKQNQAQHKKDLAKRQEAIFAGQDPASISTTETAVPPPLDQLLRGKVEDLMDLGRMQIRLSNMKNGKRILEQEWQITYGNKPIPDTKQINFTDPESRIMVTKNQGVQQCYNHFILVDDKAGIIVGVHTSNSASDHTSFIPTMQHAETILGSLDTTLVGGDTGFFSAQNQLSAIEKGYTLYTPFPKPTDPFHKDKFFYDKEEDCYICPENNKLQPGNHRPETETITYKTSACLDCPSQKKCTKARDGIRKISRNRTEDPIREQAIKYATSDEGKEIIRQRKGVVEPAFGNYRGLYKVSREFLLRCAVRNLRKAFKAFSTHKRWQDLVQDAAKGSLTAA